MTNFAIDRTSANTLAINESPFTEINGLLFYKEDCKTPQFLNSSFITTLFSEAVVVDHFVLGKEESDIESSYRVACSISPEKNRSPCRGE